FVSNMYFPSTRRPYCRRGLLPGVPSRSGQGAFRPLGPRRRFAGGAPPLSGPTPRSGAPQCRKRPARFAPGSRFETLLFAQAELLDERVVAVHILPLEVIEQRTPLVDHHQQPTARMVVLVMLLEVLGQRQDPAGEDGDLHF